MRVYRNPDAWTTTSKTVKPEDVAVKLDLGHLVTVKAAMVAKSAAPPAPVPAPAPAHKVSAPVEKPKTFKVQEGVIIRSKTPDTKAPPKATPRSAPKAVAGTAPLGKVTKSAAAESSSLYKEIEKKAKLVSRASTPTEKAKAANFSVEQAGKAKIEIEIIARFDPSFAQMLLDNTPKTQRTLRPRLVDRYAADMLANRWRVSGDPIRLNDKLELIDGQHRCAAVIKSGVTLPDVVLETLYDPRAFEVLDQAAPRNLRDVMKLSGAMPVEPTVAAAIIYEHLDFQPRVLSMPQKLQVVTACPHLQAVREMASFRIATAGMLAAFLRCLRIDREAALSFYTAAFTNTPLIDGEFEENVRLLATWIYATKHEKRVGKTAEGWKRETACRCFSAWNAWRQGRVLKRLIYSPPDAMPEPV